MKLTNVKFEGNDLEGAIEKIVSNEKLSKSQKMKDMFSLGMEIKDIANKMNVRYNFVYNVISNHCIVNELAIEKTATITKKDTIKELHSKGMTVKEIAIQLKTNYNYIYKIVKEIKEEANNKDVAK